MAPPRIIFALITTFSIGAFLDYSRSEAQPGLRAWT
jgi:hypothetical protein